MRSLLVALFVLSFQVSAVANELRFVRTWPGYRTAESFMRVSEYFSGRENTAGQTFLRTRPDERAGYYFLTRIRNKGTTLENKKLQLQIITSRSPRPTSYAYDVSIPKGEHVFQVGLTGTDWPDEAEHPVAWHLAVLDSSGATLIEDQSFLWSKPDSP